MEQLKAVLGSTSQGKPLVQVLDMATRMQLKFGVSALVTLTETFQDQHQTQPDKLSVKVEIDICPQSNNPMMSLILGSQNMCLSRFMAAPGPVHFPITVTDETFDVPAICNFVEGSDNVVVVHGRH